MKPECEAAVRAAAGGRQLTDADIRAIDERLHASAKELRREDPEGWATKTPGERAQAAAELARSKHLQQITQAHADSLRRIQLQVQRNALYDSIPAGKQVGALLTNTFLQHGKSNSTPIEAAIRALHRWAKTRMPEADERFAEDPTKQAALSAEMFGHDSGDAQAKRVAANLRAMNDEMLGKMDRAGIHVARRKYWAPQPWDYLRINDRAAFVQDMFGLLDLREFMEADGSQMSLERIHHTLDAAAETLQTNGASKRADKLDAFGHGTARGLARRYNSARQLNFKDGAAWREGMRKYGMSDNLGSLWREHFSRAARDLAIAQQYGPHADADIRQQLERAKAHDLGAAKSPKEKHAIERDTRQFLQMWDVLLRGHAPGNSQVAAWMGAVRAVMSASKIGVLANQIVSDPLMLMNYGKLVGMNTQHVTGDILRGVAGSNKQALRMLGAWSDALHETTARFGDTEVFNRVSRFLNGTVYKYSGMRAADRGMAGAITGMYYGTLGERLASGESFDALPKPWREFMQKHGIDADNWALLRKVQLSRAFDDDRQVLNPAGIHDVPDAALRSIAERRAAGSNTELQSRIDQLNGQSAREREWVANRAGKLAELRQKADAAIKHLESKEAVRAGNAEGVAAARAEVLRARVAAAEAEADIARYLDTRDQQGALLRHMDAVEDGGNRERPIIKQRTHPDNKSDSIVENFGSTPGIDENMARDVQRFARTVGAKGEKIGSLRAAAEARIDAAEKALAAREKAAGERIDAKAGTFDKRTAALSKDLANFTRDMRARALRRQDLIDAYNKQFGRAVADEVGRLKDETLTKVLGGFEDFMHAAGRGFAEGTVSENSRLGLNQTDPSSPLGIALRFAFMIRQIPFNMAFTHLFDVPAGLDGWAPRAQYITRYMLGQAVATGIALQLKHLIAGEDPEDMTSWQFLGKAVAGAGLGPLLATLIFGTGGEHQDLLGKIAGPGGDALSDLYGIATTTRDDLNKDGAVDWGKVNSRMLSFTRSNAVPFMNFWYTKAAFNHIVYLELQEKVAPGYKERVQQRLRQWEVSQWWENRETMPQRAPDFGRAVGQPAQ